MVVSLLLLAVVACTSPEATSEVHSQATAPTSTPVPAAAHPKLGCCFLKDLAEAYERGGAGVDLKTTTAYRCNGKGEFGRLALDVVVLGTKQDIRTVEQRIMEIGGEYLRRDPGMSVPVFPEPTVPSEQVREDHLVVLIPPEALVTFSEWPEVLYVSSVSRPCSDRNNSWHPIPFPTPQAKPLTITGPLLWQTYTGRVYLEGHLLRGGNAIVYAFVKRPNGERFASEVGGVYEDGTYFVKAAGFQEDVGREIEFVVWGFLADQNAIFQPHSTGDVNHDLYIGVRPGYPPPGPLPPVFIHTPSE